MNRVAALSVSELGTGHEQDNRAAHQYRRFPKAGELIEMSGLEDLETSQRAISNILYQHAHDSGRITEPGAVFEIPMSAIRQGLSKHESGDRLRASLVALARIVASVTYVEEDPNGKGS